MWPGAWEHVIDVRKKGGYSRNEQSLFCFLRGLERDQRVCVREWEETLTGYGEVRCVGEEGNVFICLSKGPTAQRKMYWAALCGREDGSREESSILG